MTFNSNKEDSDHFSKLPEHGEEYIDTVEEVKDSGKREGKQTKESIQRQQKKKIKVEETCPLSGFTSATLFIFRV